MNEQFPSEMDWVSARLKCSVDGLLAQLRERAATDARTMQRLMEGSGVVWFVTPVSGRKFVASRHDGAFNVVFQADDSGIHVDTGNANERTLLFSAKPSFGPTGNCRLEIDGVPLELWQVSQRALEGLFFNGTP